MGVNLESPAIDGLAGDGPFKPDWDSLLEYEAPEWYRDAKFGIWAHWSPQCVPEDSDWYARNMYIQGQNQYKNQLRQYGHPSKFGYKDLCAQWTLLNWEPEALIERYKSAGARLFIALANHHDGFDAWNSKHWLLAADPRHGGGQVPGMRRSPAGLRPGALPQVPGGVLGALLLPGAVFLPLLS
jgi:alpha-L-fucosidase